MRGRIRVWTEREEQYIRRAYGVTPTILLSLNLLRSTSCIQSKAWRMGIGTTQNKLKAGRKVDTGDRHLDPERHRRMCRERYWSRKAQRAQREAA